MKCLKTSISSLNRPPSKGLEDTVTGAMDAISVDVEVVE